MGWPSRSDERLWSEQRASLRNAIGEFRTLFGKSDAIDPRFVRVVEQSAGLKDLKFETDPAASEREMQPVMDAQGRIAGFLTWDKVHPMMLAMQRLLPLIVGIPLVLVGFAGFSLWQLRRARRELAASEEHVQRAADEDKLTGLPNHAKTLELLDLALAERAGGDVTTFALIELDGMADVDAHLGVLGSDELIGAVARRLKEALPAGAVCGRIGSNEFAVIFSAGSDVDAGAILRTALNAIARPHWIDTVVRISAHAGFAQAPRHAGTRGELTRRAELALRAAAKKAAGAIVAYERAIDTVSTEQKFIQRELPRALTANELELHYQPIVAAHGARIVGVEALLRWTHRDARADRAGGLHSGRRTDGSDGRARRLRAAPRASRGQALARSLCGGEPVAAAGARRFHRRTGALGAGRERRAAGAADAGNHRRRADRQSGRDGQAHRGPARARRAHRARRFRLRLFQSRLSAALPARQAQDRPQLRDARSAIPPMAG